MDPANFATGSGIRTGTGVELTVTRIDTTFFGREGMLAFVEDSDAQWLKMPAAPDQDVEIVT